MKFYLMVKAAGDSPIAFLIKKDDHPISCYYYVMKALIIFVAC